MHSAVVEGDAAIVKLLLERGADRTLKAKSWNDGTALDMAYEKGYSEIADLLK